MINKKIIINFIKTIIIRPIYKKCFYKISLKYYAIIYFYQGLIVKTMELALVADKR